MNESNQLPMAHPDYEKWTEELFPDREMSPEEYAARHGHEHYLFSFHNYQYENAILNEWIQQLAAIFFTPGALDRCREQFLTPEEISTVKAIEQEL